MTQGRKGARWHLVQRIPSCLFASVKFMSTANLLDDEVTSSYLRLLFLSDEHLGVFHPPVPNLTNPDIQICLMGVAAVRVAYGS